MALRRRGARGGGREGKRNTQPEVSPVPPPKRNARSCLLCNSEGTHAPPLRPEVTASHTGQARASGCSARSAARRPAPALAPRGRCTSPGQCERDAPAPRRRCPAAASSFRGGRIPARLPPRAAAPTRRSAPRRCHLQTQPPAECLKITMLPGRPLPLSHARRLAANGTRRPSARGRPLAGALAGGGLGASPPVAAGRRAAGAPAPLALPALQQGRFSVWHGRLGHRRGWGGGRVTRRRTRKPLGS